MNADTNWTFKPDSPWSEALPVQQECADVLNSDELASMSGIVTLPCGAGKTRIALEQALKCNHVLFLSFEMAGVSQFSAALKEHTTIDERFIVTFTGSSKDRPNHLFCYMSTHYSMLTGLTGKSDESKRILEFIRQNSWDMVILDECHHAPSAAYKASIQSLSTHTTRMLGITATPIRKLSKQVEASTTQEERNAVMECQFDFIGPILFSKRWKEMESEKFVASINFVVVETAMDQKTQIAYEQATNLTRAYIGSLPATKMDAVWNITRLHMFRNQTGIIFCDHVWQANEVAAMLGKGWYLMRGSSEDETEASSSTDASAATSLEARMQIKNRLNADEEGVWGIVATKVADAALDIFSPRFCYGISVDASCSESTNAQRAGRVMRNNPKWDTQKTAFFYDLITPGTPDESASDARRRFIEEEEYSYKRVEHTLFSNALRGSLPKTQDEFDARPWFRVSVFNADHAHFCKESLSLLVRGLRVAALAEGRRIGKRHAAGVKAEHRQKQASVKARVDGAKNKLFKARHAEQGKRLSSKTKVVEAAAKELKANAQQQSRYPDHLLKICCSLRDKAGITDAELEEAGVDPKALSPTD